MNISCIGIQRVKTQSKQKGRKIGLSDRFVANNRFLKVNVDGEFQWRFQQFKPRKCNSTKNDYNFEPEHSHAKSLEKVLSKPPLNMRKEQRERHYGTGITFNAGSYIELAELGFAEAADIVLEEF